MIIKSIKLNNIRSYLNQEINFPSGSTLLAGDIGSGKSTILLAIEFALFGAKKTELPAHTVLRNGKNNGSVELKLDLEGREVIINRNLKRGKNGISQESGYLIKDELKKEGTHIELKTMMLDFRFSILDFEISSILYQASSISFLNVMFYSRTFCQQLERNQLH